ncbi:MAG: DNA-3-methyladenine glycosylase I, partial [Pseudomonadota bacterium]
FFGLRIMPGFCRAVLILAASQPAIRSGSNPKKVEATVNNAKVYVHMRENGEDFADYLWTFIGGRPLVNSLENYKEGPAKTALSEALSKDLKKRGFKFCGPVIVYAFMQAVGMVNDHEVKCPRHRAVQELAR